jgi:hypothetical protein
MGPGPCLKIIITGKGKNASYIARGKSPCHGHCMLRCASEILRIVRTTEQSRPRGRCLGHRRLHPSFDRVRIGPPSSWSSRKHRCHCLVQSSCNHLYHIRHGLHRGNIATTIRMSSGEHRCHIMVGGISSGHLVRFDNSVAVAGGVSFSIIWGGTCSYLHHLQPCET